MWGGLPGLATLAHALDLGGLLVNVKHYRVSRALPQP